MTAERIDTKTLVEKMEALRAEIDGPTPFFASKLLNDLYGQLIGTFRLEQQYQKMRRDGEVRMMEAFEGAEKLTEADFDNLFRAEDLHTEIAKRLAKKSGRPA